VSGARRFTPFFPLDREGGATYKYEEED